MTAPGVFPTFLIIGAQKSATRWLRANLGFHPSVFTAERELEFFNHNWARGPGWYWDCFAKWNGETAVGEATPGYMMWNEHPARQAARIDGLLPGVRVVAILRNPIERSYSAFIHFMRDGRIPTDASLIERCRQVPPEEDPLCIIAGSWYAACLDPYVRRFRERLLILTHESVAIDPIGVYKRAARHIGVDPAFVPDEVGSVRFSNPTPEGSAYSSAAGGRRELTLAERRELFAYFVDDVNRLRQVVDMEFGTWRP